MKMKSVFFIALLVSLMLFSFLTATGSALKRDKSTLSKTTDPYESLGIIKMNPLSAPDFRVESLDGMHTKLSDFRGKVVFLNFWATWCGPCRSEVKDIDSLYNSLKDEDFTVMAVDIGEEKGKVMTFMDKYKIDFPVYLDSTGAIAANYGVRGIPMTFIIDPSGNVVGRALGPRIWGSQESVKLMRSLMK